MDWFQIGKGVCQGCMLSPCVFNLSIRAHHVKCRADEAQAGIKTAGRNTSNLRPAGDTTLMAESKELKPFWWRWKNEKDGLKLNIQKTKIMASGPITSG